MDIKDISALSLSELQRLRTRVEAELKRRAETSRKDLLKKVQKLASEHGMSLEELLDGEAPKAAAKPAPRAAASTGKRRTAGPKKGSTVAPKYRHPEDSSLTWTGRGRQPLWVGSFIENGGTLESLLIQAPPAE